MRSNMWIREHELSLQTFPGKILSSVGSQVQDLRILGKLYNNIQHNHNSSWHLEGISNVCSNASNPGQLVPCAFRVQKDST